VPPPRTVPVLHHFLVMSSASWSAGICSQVLPFSLPPCLQGLRSCTCISFSPLLHLCCNFQAGSLQVSPLPLLEPHTSLSSLCLRTSGSAAATCTSCCSACCTSSCCWVCTCWLLLETLPWYHLPVTQTSATTSPPADHLPLYTIAQPGLLLLVPLPLGCLQMPPCTSAAVFSLLPRPHFPPSSAIFFTITLQAAPAALTTQVTSSTSSPAFCFIRCLPSGFLPLHFRAETRFCFDSALPLDLHCRYLLPDPLHLIPHASFSFCSFCWAASLCNYLLLPVLLHCCTILSLLMPFHLPRSAV